MTINDKNVFTKNVSLNIFLPFHLNRIDVGPVSEAREFEKIHRREKKLFVEQRDDFYFFDHESVVFYIRCVLMYPVIVDVKCMGDFTCVRDLRTRYHVELDRVRDSGSFIRSITTLTIFSGKILSRFVNEPSKPTPYTTIV